MDRITPLNKPDGNIRSVGYEADTQTLEIEFSSGGIYNYAGVPPEVHDKLMHAESPGSYFSLFIRGHYDYIRLNPKKESLDVKVPNPSLEKDLRASIADVTVGKKTKARKKANA